MTQIEALRQAVAVSPDNAPLLSLLGEACLDQFLFDEARQHFQNALSRDPQNFSAQLGLARVAYQSGQTSEAVLRTEALTQANPNSGAAWRLLSRLAFIEGRVEEAREHYARAREIEPTVRDAGLEKDLAASPEKKTTPRDEKNTPLRAGPTDGEDD
jgi:transitional endoplasmic reticulum ATPase